jgi:phospholipase D1/2
MHSTYVGLCKGPNSIFGKIEAAGFNPRDYIGCYNLRSYDRLADPAVIKQTEFQSGIKWEQVQGALARLYMSDPAEPRELHNNPVVRIHTQAVGESIKKEETQAANQFIEGKMPVTTLEAWNIIEDWRKAYPRGYPSGEGVARSAMLGGDLYKEPWAGTELDEKQSYITEGSSFLVAGTV